MGMATHRNINIRFEILNKYWDKLGHVDSAFKRYLDVSRDMQDLADRALPYIDSVVVPYLCEGGDPELILVADGVEQEAAAWRALGEFCVDSGWVEVWRSKDGLVPGVNSVRLYHAGRNCRLYVAVRCMEV